MGDQFKTIKAEARAETKVQGSRFVAIALPIATKADAEQFISRTRKEFWDATHCCFAYRLGIDGREFRYNDDGEPAGSAGKPILAELDKRSLTDAIIVVIRYFGGTKLGVGGLVRAYGGAAEQSLQKTELQIKFILQIVEASYSHSHISNVIHVVSKLGAKIVDTQYGDDVHATIEVRLSRAEELKSALVNQTNGNIDLKAGG